MMKMRAVWYEQLGKARDVLKVGELDQSDPGPGEVRVRVSVSGINPSDIKRRSGANPSFPRFPHVIPHMDGAGTIDSVGENVDPSRVGERVWIYEAELGRPFGTAAEYSVVPTELAVKLPENVDFEAGATLGVPAMTAHRCLFADGSIAGKTVLVTGGAGAVGNYAIQLAKWGKAAEVIATTSSEEKSDVARWAGADHVVNYKTENVVEKIKQITSDKGVDQIIDVAFNPNLKNDLGVLKINGVISTYSSDAEVEPRIPFYTLMRRGITVHYVLVYVMPRTAHLAAIRDIDDALKAGQLRPKIAARFHLSETIEAHELVESGTAVGKVLVTTMD